MEDDVISRQAALDTLIDMPCKVDEDGYVWILRIDAWKRIDALPSAQPEYRLDEWCTDCKEYDHERHCCPRWNRVIRTTLQDAQSERKEGHWIRKSNWMWTCSCCGKDNAYAYTDGDAFEPTVLQDFFCPRCGAKMGGEKE